jgi:hypothetical protein
MIKKVIFNNIIRFNQHGQLYFQQTFRAKIFFIYYKFLTIIEQK